MAERAVAECGGVELAVDVAREVPRRREEQAEERRRRLARPRLELRVVLHAEEEGVRLPVELDHLHPAPRLVLPDEVHALLREVADELRVHLVPVAVALVHEALRARLVELRAEAGGGAEVEGEGRPGL